MIKNSTRTALMFLFAVLMMGNPIKSAAQGQDVNFKWNGNTISDVLASSEPDVQTFYLYNVGSNKFLNTGSYWGTSISAFKVGMPLKFVQNPDGTYKIQGTIETNSGKYLGFPAPSSSGIGTPNQYDWDRIYCDRGVLNPTGDHCDWVITDVSSGGKTYYTLYIENPPNQVIGGTRYLSVEPDASSYRNEIVYPTSVSTGDLNGMWQLVTLKDLKDAFKDQFASNEAPADATFLIGDQNFDVSNGDVVKWQIAGDLTQKYPVGDYNFAFSPEAAYSYFVGCRSVLGDGYQREYGRHWVGNVRNVGNDSHANGTITQSVTTLKKGWYRVSCDGFYAPDSGSGLTSSLFAKVAGESGGESNVQTLLNKLEPGTITYTIEDLTKTRMKWSQPALAIEDSPYTLASKLFETNTYNNSILVYVPENGQRLDIGIQVEGSTGDLDWTAFDNFQLQYCGNNDMILDEDQTDIEYITKQVEPHNANTLILKRTMTPGRWSSITLPVALTAAQFKTAFGDQAKLSKLKGQSPTIASRIDFESVNLTNDNSVVIEPGKLYIMRPTRSANVTTGSYSKTIAQGMEITVQAPYYTINNVTLAATPAPTFKETSKPSTTVDRKLQFCGTQIYQTTPFVPAYSYVLGANDGLWHFTKSVLPIKGFRCWIATGDDAQAKDITFFIDDEEQGTITAIENISADTVSTGSTKHVYNLNGQLVRHGATSLEGLPKGIYIVNNKKVIVK